MTLPSSTADQPIRLIIVEDDAANRIFFADYLIYAGFAVLPLPHGLDLEYHLKEFQPHGLLLDLGLPEIDGYTLLQQLRASATWSHLPVIVVSGYAFAEDQHRAMALGAQTYLVKPVSPQQLTQAIHAAIADSRGQPPP